MSKKNIKLNISNNYSSKNGSSLIFVVFFLVVFLAFAAFAVDGTIVLTNRAELQSATEMTALAAAAEFNNPLTATSDVHSPTCKNIEDHIRATAKDTFKLLNQGSLKNVDVDNINFFSVNVPPASNKVTVSTTMISQPFFLAFLGVSGIKLDAKASAVSEELNVKSSYAPSIIWVTPSAAYLSDILSKDVNMNDTAIVTPLGNGPSVSYPSSVSFPDFRLIDSQGDNKSLSLGPGGFITIKLPDPIIDKPGADLEIDEYGVLDSILNPDGITYRRGVSEGYMVFAGLDNDPTQPYVDKDNTGKGISWVNISASGTSIAGLGDKAILKGVATLGCGPQDKFYGSGTFDIGASGLSMAKYIRIVDDNSETGFVNYNGNPYMVMLYGEASTYTPGADIDAVKVLNHVKLVSSSGS